ncbi:phosphatase PAP2 family protein [Bifidobacterium vespertilionis]|nr:phosphatase PAP2 family protein [Bifidobacterium vespertilionis]
MTDEQSTDFQPNGKLSDTSDGGPDGRRPVFVPLEWPAAPVAPAPAPPLAHESRTPDEPEDLASTIRDIDPLTFRPRVSSVVMCVLFGVSLVAASVGVWWFAVRTVAGQQLDDMVLGAFHDTVPGWMTSLTGFGAVVSSSAFMIGMAVAMGLGGLAIDALRKRWWGIGQVAAFAVVAYAAARLLKEFLPRETLVRTVITESGAPLTNTAPSGHAALTIAAALVLVCAVPRAARAVTVLLAGSWSVLVSLLLVANGWHRPSDIVMAYLLVSGLALVALAFTRRDGMDEPGTRVSSVSVQIVCSVLVTAGVVACLYVAYVVWQFAPSLDVGPEWMIAPAVAASKVAFAGVAALTFGLVLTMRQLTAAPLSKVGLVGAPPAPPKA